MPATRDDLRTAVSNGHECLELAHVPSEVVAQKVTEALARVMLWKDDPGMIDGLNRGKVYIQEALSILMGDIEISPITPEDKDMILELGRRITSEVENG